MRDRLWPHAGAAELAREAQAFVAGANVPTVDAVFLADDGGIPIGFIELAIRPFSDGCDSQPVPHVEGWYVEPFARGRGVGRALMAGERWARERGFVELALDAEVENVDSLHAHEACGFAEVERIIKFRKALA